MTLTLRALLWCFLLVQIGYSSASLAQGPPVETCAAFASNGDLLTGTVGDGELQLDLRPLGHPPVHLHEAVQNTMPCETSFSQDGHWAAVVVRSNELTIFIVDRESGTIHNKFSSPWYGLPHAVTEPGYQGDFLGGFLADISVVLWRYEPLAVADAHDASHVEIHRQLWSIEGKLLLDQNLGPLGWSGSRTPIVSDRGKTLWLSGSCNETCFRELSISEQSIHEDGTITIPEALANEPAAVPSGELLLAVAGNQRTSQQVVLLDKSGHTAARLKLPFISNPFHALVPDWFGVRNPKLSPDGEVAAIARTRIAWVLNDTDRDWGSEIILLQTQPLGVLATYKTGRSGVGAIAVDHRNGITRLVGYWNHRWHDLRCDPSGKCNSPAL